MSLLTLSSHQRERRRAPVTVDHCAACRLVWFDAFESVQLDTLGWVHLLRTMEQGAGRDLPPALVARPACPTCNEPLKTVRNRTRYGRFAALECPAAHGHLHSHSGLLAERGLVRPLGAAERRALAQEKHRLHCFNCGGAAQPLDDQCSWCGTALVVVDLPRLAHSLRPRDEAAGPSPQARGRHVAWACRGCGAALDPGRETQCGHCGHLVVAHELPDIVPLLAAAEADLSVAAAAVDKVRARFPDQQRQWSPGAERRPASARAKRWMLGGWLPLLVTGIVALLLVVAIAADWHWPPRPPLQALRAELVGNDAGAAWGWVAEHRRIAPQDLDDRRRLAGGLLDLQLRQITGDKRPAGVTLGALMDGSPAGLDADRWQRALSLSLRVLPATGDEPFPAIDVPSDLRYSSAAPAVWVERDRRQEGIWTPRVENPGPLVVLPIEQLEVRMNVAPPDGVPWRCVREAGAAAWLAPGQSAVLWCRTRVRPSDQEVIWHSAMAGLQSGVPAPLTWQGRGAGMALLDQAIAAAPATRPVAVAPTLAQRWARTSTGRRAVLVLAALALFFTAYCGLGRRIGARPAFFVSLLLMLVPSVWAGRGEGAASVLLIGMYVALSVIVLLAFSFGFRFYRDVMFGRFAGR